ncbi:GumC domain-containing protein [Anaeromyxobacter terrae]|uniref:hypothetical protein n=1 Tax=Anaeromyxobacter terrae TaxID=2925406 RepID=UPI001F586C64|nr:hypothetical protein [Anaeromyxobacter sp. SG22]
MVSSVDLSFLRNPRAVKRIALTTLACLILATAYGLFAPKWYRSVLTVVPARPQRGGSISSLLGGELAGLAAGFDTSMAGSDAPRIAAVLESIAVSDAVIQRFDLRTRYRAGSQESARDALWRHCAVRALPKPNLVQLTCEDKEPRFVQRMLEFFAEYGNAVFRSVSVSSASEEVRFLEKRVADLRQQASDASARMREFQERHRIVDLETQSRAVVSALAALNSQLITKQLELDYARTFSTRDESTTQQLESQLSLLTEKLRDLEEPAAPLTSTAQTQGRKGKGRSSGMFPAALEVPKLRAEFEALYRDRKVSETTLVFALERLESARANEAREVSTFLVLDPPTLPTRHSRPRLLQAVGLLTGLALAGSLFFEWWWNKGGRLVLLAPPTSERGRGRTAE